MVTQITNYVTGEAAFAVDRSGVIVLWNSAAENTLGYSASTALGQHCWELLCGQDVYGNQYCNRHCPLREMAFKHESVNSYQVIFSTASEGRKQYTISCLVVFNRPGKELLLHMCHPEKDIREVGNTRAITRPSANSQRRTLTPREIEVLALLAERRSTREIASIMCISIPTVRNHIQHVLHKLNAHNRLEVVILGKQLNLI